MTKKSDKRTDWQRVLLNGAAINKFTAHLANYGAAVALILVARAVISNNSDDGLTQWLGIYLAVLGLMLIAWNWISGIYQLFSFFEGEEIILSGSAKKALTIFLQLFSALGLWAGGAALTTWTATLN